jgi:hypothetical protein
MKICEKTPISPLKSKKQDKTLKISTLTTRIKF